MAGYLPDNVGFYDEMTGWDNLMYTAALNGLARAQAADRIGAALERVGLAKDGCRKVGEYSRGMRQRLGIADVLIKDPKLLILDEPTLGIDPEGAQKLLHLIVDLARRDKRTILLSSHVLHQVQQVCDQVGIFVDGQLIACGAISELETQLTGDTIKIELAAAPDDQNLVQLCRQTGGVESVAHKGEFLVLNCREDIRTELVKNLLYNGYALRHLCITGFTLDDIYRRYFHKEWYHADG
jgi:ABC-2 type transport system ATP-binding protein